MDGSHDDQNFRCKIKNLCSKTCVFCCKKYPIPTSIVILFFLLYLFFPLVFKILIYTLPLVGFSLLVHRHLSVANRQMIKQVEEDERRKKFAKSRRSFKSVYSDHSRIIRQNTLKKSDDHSDTNVDDKDDIFSKSLHELLFEKKSKDIVNFESIAGKVECSSSNGKVKDDHPQVDHKDDHLEDDDKPKDHKVVQWTEDDQKNGMDLGLAEAERNTRLQSLMVRRRSRKNLGIEESGSTGNNDNVQIPAVKTTKINPFLENHSDGKKSPGSAPSSMLKTNNPFDLPYDPHEEKLDLTGDNFHEEFTLSQPKDPVFCRHQSFSLGALSHSVTSHDKHERSYYKDISDKQNSANGLETSTLDSYDARKADINFFYGSSKKPRHVVSYSMVSDMQVELSDEDSVPTLDDLDIEKERESMLNPSNPQEDSETNENPKPLNSDTIQSNHIQEPHRADQSSVAQAAPDGLTELALGQASVNATSPKSVLHQTNGDSGEHPFRDRDIDNLQDQNVRQL